MPCEWYEMPGGSVLHINRGHSTGARRTCKFCGQKYREGKLCDFPVGNGRTCDAEMCDRCARTLGAQNSDVDGVSGMKRLGDTIDVCPIHRDQALVRDGKLVAEEPMQRSLFEVSR